MIPCTRIRESDHLKGLCGFGLISFTDVLPDADLEDYTSGHMLQENSNFPASSLMRTIYKLNKNKIDFSTRI